MGLDREIEERKIAQDELARCSHLYWVQAEFFLTFNTALMGLTGLVFSYRPHYLFLIPFISGFGIFVSVIWLFHGNRIDTYRKITEECIKQLEQSGNFKVKIVLYQNGYFKRSNLPYLERYSSTKLTKTVLPLGIIVSWCLIFGSSLFSL